MMHFIRIHIFGSFLLSFGRDANNFPVIRSGHTDFLNPTEKMSSFDSNRIDCASAKDTIRVSGKAGNFLEPHRCPDI